MKTITLPLWALELDEMCAICERIISAVQETETENDLERQAQIELREAIRDRVSLIPDN